MDAALVVVDGVLLPDGIEVAAAEVLPVALGDTVASGVALLAAVVGRAADEVLVVVTLDVDVCDDDEQAVRPRVRTPARDAMLRPGRRPRGDAEEITARA